MILIFTKYENYTNYLDVKCYFKLTLFNIIKIIAISNHIKNHLIIKIISKIVIEIEFKLLYINLIQKSFLKILLKYN